jgi:ribokinase
MGKFLVSGLINLETTLKVDRFPIDYCPVRYSFGGVQTTISGVGLNITKALRALGNDVTLCSMIGSDFTGAMLRHFLANMSLSDAFILDLLDETPQSVILYDHTGTRQINVDLKDVQEKKYPEDKFQSALVGCDVAILTNVNYSRQFLKFCRSRNIMIASDVHAVSVINDEYNRDFMDSATVLFMSDENLPCSPEEWMHKLWYLYGAEIIVISMGGKGALLGIRDGKILQRFPAVVTRPIVNTIGAGDALFSAFLHCYQKYRDPYDALQKAVIFASYKIGERGAASGFLNNDELISFTESLLRS